MLILLGNGGSEDRRRGEKMYKMGKTINQSTQSVNLEAGHKPERSGLELWGVPLLAQTKYDSIDGHRACHHLSVGRLLELKGDDDEILSVDPFSPAAPVFQKYENSGVFGGDFQFFWCSHPLAAVV